MPQADSTPRMKYRQKWQENNRRAKGVKPQQIAPCGTPAAYRRHLRHKKLAEEHVAAGRPDAIVDGRPASEVAVAPIDDACRDAWNADAAARRASKRKPGKRKRKGDQAA